MYMYYVCKWFTNWNIQFTHSLCTFLARDAHDAIAMEVEVEVEIEDLEDEDNARTSLVI